MVRRYLSADSRTNLIGSIVFSVIGLLILGVIGWMWSSDPNATIANVAPFGLIGLGLGLGPLTWAFLTGKYLRVDEERRSAAFIAKGKARWTCALEELGPLSLARWTLTSKDEGRTEHVFYRVLCAGQSNLPIHQVSTYAEARRLAVTLAAKWGVGVRTLDGQLHTVDALNEPLRLPRAAPEPRALAADSGVSIESREDGVTLKSANVASGFPFPDLFLIGGAAMGFVALNELPVSTIVAEPFADPGQTALAVIATVFGSAFLVMSLRQIKGAFTGRPDTISIDARTITYGPSVLALEDVKEVTYADGIAVVGGAGSFTVDPMFCKTSSVPALIAELRGLIVAGAARVRSVPNV